ncbi:hypothetical protein ACQPZX_18405 [Actinoplanes sp. CA-142083]|uniref:hypothetical protein n=1 Tax=Actinoplanes sp. CA-142083 TaxID=3239903 RepID=UPI003D8AE48A
MNDDDESGYSLLEVVVATGFMLMVLVMVAGGLSLIYSNFNRVDELGTARDQIGNSFRRLDKELRYATWVSKEGQVGNAWYLEYATTTDCRQLVFNNGVLTRAIWTLPGTTPGAPTTIATNLTLTDAGIPPFKVYAPGDQPFATPSPSPSPSATGIDNGVGKDYELEHSQIRLRFTGRLGKTTLPLDVLFTAQNTNRNTPAANDCSKGRPTA